MVYGIIGMINFAHGEIFMIGAFVSIITFLLLGIAGITWIPLALLIVLIVAMLLTSIYGWALERVAYRPLRGSPRLAALITAIGMSIFLQNYVQLLQSARNKPMQPVISGGVEVMREGSYIVSLSFMQMIIIVLTFVLMIIFSSMIARTALGRSQRACEQTFVMGAALASVAGMMFLMYYGVIDFFIGFLAGIKAFTAAVLGGIGSLPGAMLGGLLIGLIEAFWSGYFTVEYKDVAAFSILVLVLIFRPSGLLGRPDIEKV
jgi:branched-chain amino acid transport system permease protein